MPEESHFNRFAMRYFAAIVISIVCVALYFHNAGTDSSRRIDSAINERASLSRPQRDKEIPTPQQIEPKKLEKRQSAFDINAVRLALGTSDVFADMPSIVWSRSDLIGGTERWLGKSKTFFLEVTPYSISSMTGVDDILTGLQAVTIMAELNTIAYPDDHQMVNQDYLMGLFKNATAHPDSVFTKSVGKFDISLVYFRYLSHLSYDIDSRKDE